MKRRRTDLCLRQRDVAMELGVKAQTIGHWESGKHLPPPRLAPRIHTFLGLCPYDPAWTFAERLRAAREAQGLSRRQAAALVGLDEGTLARLETGILRTTGRSAKAVAKLRRTAR